MIISDPTRVVPTEWTDALIGTLYEHARDLAEYGNAAGFFLLAHIAHWTSARNQHGRFLRHRDRWDYDAIRAYIAAHPAEVAHVWQLCNRSAH